MPIVCRPFLEPLEDRNLLSALLTPPVGTPAGNQNAAQTVALAKTVGSPQQVILAVSRQQSSFFMNQATVPTTASIPVQLLPTASSAAVFAFPGYPALQDPSVNFRSALGYGNFLQQSGPGVFAVGGAQGAQPPNQQNAPLLQPPPPPPLPLPPPVRTSTLASETPTFERADDDSGGETDNQMGADENRIPAPRDRDSDQDTSVDGLTFLALANAPRLDASDSEADTTVIDLALGTDLPFE